MYTVYSAANEYSALMGYRLGINLHEQYYDSMNNAKVPVFTRVLPSPITCHSYSIGPQAHPWVSDTTPYGIADDDSLLSFHPWVFALL